MSRSPTVVIAYLMAKNHSFKEAYDKVLSLRAIVSGCCNLELIFNRLIQTRVQPMFFHETNAQGLWQLSKNMSEN